MFSIKYKDGLARAGTLKTRSGEIKTPFFMPVATFATGKGLSSGDYHVCGVQAIICNAFLLSLKPGTATIKSFGDLRTFMNFKGSIFTDSGGFQSSSKKMFLGASRKGVHLKSPFDGKRHVMTPQHLVTVQEDLGSDIAMVIDDMAPANATKEQFDKALGNTHRWAVECLANHKDKKQLLFAIVQGGYDVKLRRESAELLATHSFDGFAIGGCAIGEPKTDMYRAIHNAVPYLPENKPRYLMGVGSPPDIVQAVSLGVDCFDSIFPTRNARHRMIFTMQGTYHLDKGKYVLDKESLEEGCDCFTCQHHSRGYVRHLVTVDEGERLCQLHNIRFMMRLMEHIRTAIKEHRFEAFREEFFSSWFAGKIPKVYKECLD
jgi:queuine tRNA-ribosyltransferase